jgi:hypothetical protein
MSSRRGEGGEDGRQYRGEDGDQSARPKQSEPAPGKHTVVGGGSGRVGGQTLIQQAYGAGGETWSAGRSAAHAPAVAHKQRDGGDGAPLSDDGRHATRSDLLTVNPPQLRFGNVPYKAGHRDRTEAAPYEVTVVNTSDEAVTLEDIRADAGTDFQIFSSDTTETAIAPGATFRFRVGFRPSRIGTQTSTIHLLANGGVSVGHVYVEAHASPDNATWEDLHFSNRDIRFDPTPINQESAPKAVQITNRSGVPVRIEDVASTSGDTDQFRVHETSAEEIPAGGSTDLAVTFKPKSDGDHVAFFGLRTPGTTAHDKGSPKNTLRVHGQGRGATQDEAVAATSESLGDVAQTGGAMPPTITYADMLGALRAAQRFTEAGADHDAHANYARAEALLTPVKARMDSLSDRLPEFASHYGVASTTAYLSFGAAHTAVTDWYRKLRLDSSIRPDYFITAFEANEEIIKVLTGEKKEAPTLRTLEHGGNMVAVAAAAAPIVAVAAPIIAEEAGIIWYGARWGFSRAAVWAFSNPEAAVELTGYLSTLGVSIGEAGGLGNFLRGASESPEAFFTTVAQFLEPAVNLENQLNGSSGARSGGGAAEPETEGSAPPGAPRVGAANNEPEPAATGAPRVANKNEPAAPEPLTAASPSVVRVKNAVMTRVRAMVDHVEEFANTGGARGAAAKSPAADEHVEEPAAATGATAQGARAAGPEPTHDDEVSVARRSQPGSAEQMVDTLAKAKALPEQHAHEQGSVPVQAVLSALEESPALSAAQRQQQIEFINDWLKDATGGGKRSVAVHDLSPDATAARTNNGEVQEPESVVIASAADAEKPGVLNELLDAKRAAQAAKASGNSAAYVEANARVESAIRRYRELIAMQKPDGARYGAGVEPASEFFVKYKMIEAHGLRSPEIAASRASAEQLGMQELRYSPDHNGDDAMERIHEDARNLNENRPSDADVSLTYATTKNRLNDEDPAKNEQALNREFVDRWYEDKELQGAFNGLDSAGMESAAKGPGAQWESAAVRSYRNAKVVAAHLDAQLADPAAADALAERLARQRGTSVDEARELIQRYRGGSYDEAIAEVDSTAAATRASDTALRARREAMKAELVAKGMSPRDAMKQVDAAIPWHPSIPGADAAGGKLNLRFGGIDVEELSAQTREIEQALRVWSAETGQEHANVATLGMTVHAGEQLTNKNVDPFVLLDQVDQALSMGTDRIGHGLILGVEPEVLVQKGLLPPDRVAEFRARQSELVARARTNGVVIETNISSNTEISNLTQGEHPAGKFIKDGMRVTVNTDDETVLATDMQRELERVARVPGVERDDVAAVVLEGYRSRLGNRELANRVRIKASLTDGLVAGMPEGEANAFVERLAKRFGVAPQGSRERTLSVLLDAVLGVN